MEPRDASDIDGQNREVEWHAVLAGIFSRGKTGRSSRDSIYCPANCRALSSNNGSSPRSATRVTDVCSFAITSPEWSEWDERHRRQSDEGRSEGARAANEFQNGLLQFL